MNLFVVVSVGIFATLSCPVAVYGQIRARPNARITTEGFAKTHQGVTQPEIMLLDVSASYNVDEPSREEGFRGITTEENYEPPDRNSFYHDILNERIRPRETREQNYHYHSPGANSAPHLMLRRFHGNGNHGFQNKVKSFESNNPTTIINPSNLQKSIYKTDKPDHQVHEDINNNPVRSAAFQSTHLTFPGSVHMKEKAHEFPEASYVPVALGHGASYRSGHSHPSFDQKQANKVTENLRLLTDTVPPNNARNLKASNNYAQKGIIDTHHTEKKGDRPKIRPGVGGLISTSNSVMLQEEPVKTHLNTEHRPAYSLILNEDVRRSAESLPGYDNDNSKSNGLQDRPFSSTLGYEKFIGRNYNQGPRNVDSSLFYPNGGFPWRSVLKRSVDSTQGSVDANKLYLENNKHSELPGQNLAEQSVHSNRQITTDAELSAEPLENFRNNHNRSPVRTIPHHEFLNDAYINPGRASESQHDFRKDFYDPRSRSVTNIDKSSKTAPQTFIMTINGQNKLVNINEEGVTVIRGAPRIGNNEGSPHTLPQSAEYERLTGQSAGRTHSDRNRETDILLSGYESEESNGYHNSEVEISPSVHSSKIYNSDYGKEKEVPPMTHPSRTFNSYHNKVTETSPLAHVSDRFRADSQRDTQILSSSHRPRAYDSEREILPLTLGSQTFTSDYNRQKEMIPKRHGIETFNDYSIDADFLPNGSLSKRDIPKYLSAADDLSLAHYSHEKNMATHHITPISLHEQHNGHDVEWKFEGSDELVLDGYECPPSSRRGTFSGCGRHLEIMNPDIQVFGNKQFGSVNDREEHELPFDHGRTSIAQSRPRFTNRETYVDGKRFNVQRISEQRNNADTESFSSLQDQNTNTQMFNNADGIRQRMSNRNIKRIRDPEERLSTKKRPVLGRNQELVSPQ